MKNTKLFLALLLLISVSISCSKNQSIVSQVPTNQTAKKKPLSHRLVELAIDYCWNHGSPSWVNYMGTGRQYYCEGWWGICGGSMLHPNENSDPKNRGSLLKDPDTNERYLLLPESVIEHTRGDSVDIGSDMHIYTGDTLKSGTYQILNNDSMTNFIIF